MHLEITHAIARDIKLVQKSTSGINMTEEGLRTFPGQSRHLTRHSCSPPGAVRTAISKLSSGYFTFIAPRARINDSGARSYEWGASKLRETANLGTNGYAPQWFAPVMSAGQKGQDVEVTYHPLLVEAWAYSNQISSDQCRLASSSGSREIPRHLNSLTKLARPPAPCQHDDAQHRIVRAVVFQPPALPC